MLLDREWTWFRPCLHSALPAFVPLKSSLESTDLSPRHMEKNSPICFGIYPESESSIKKKLLQGQ